MQPLAEQLAQAAARVPALQEALLLPAAWSDLIPAALLKAYQVYILQQAMPMPMAAQAEQVIATYAPLIALRVGAEHEGWVRLEGQTGSPRC